MRWAIALSGAAWILIGVVLVAARGPGAPANPAPIIEAARPKGDPELQRCRELGEVATHNAACRMVWASARTRFFDGGRS